MRPRFRGAGGGHDAVGEVGIADGPLERLLRAHREADDRAHVRHLQLVDEQPMDRFDVVADGRHRKARAVKRLGRVARRRGVAVAEKLGGDQEQRRKVERATGADQPLVAMVVRHVVRRQQDRVVARRVEPAVGAVDDPRLRQRDAALGAEVVDRELVMFGGVRRRGGAWACGGKRG